MRRINAVWRSAVMFVGDAGCLSPTMLPMPSPSPSPSTFATVTNDHDYVYGRGVRLVC
jgi:hypothetical protein